MLSSSVAGAGSICLGCQLRAVTTRASVLASAAVATASSSTVVSAGTAAQSSIQRRYASNSNASASGSSSNDDFFERVLREQRVAEARGGAAAAGPDLSKSDWDVDPLPVYVPKPGSQRRPKTEAPSVISKRQREAYAQGDYVLKRTFTDPSRREAGSYTQGEVTWEDVFQQDPHPELQLPDEHEDEDGEELAWGRDDPKNRPRPGDDNPDELDFGYIANDETPSVGTFSWNRETVEETKAKFADKRKPKIRPPPLEYQEPVSDFADFRETFAQRMEETKRKTARLDPEDPFNQHFVGSLHEAPKASRANGFEPYVPSPEEQKQREIWAKQAAEKAAFAQQVDAALLKEPHTTATEDWGEWGKPSFANTARATETAPQEEEPTPSTSETRYYRKGSARTAENVPREGEPTPSTREPRYYREGSARTAGTVPREEESTPSTPEPRYYRKGSAKLVEKSGDMSIATLGENRPVIILREDGQWEKQSYPWDREGGRVVAGQKIEEIEDQEMGLSLETILENIEEIRPTSKILPAREFKMVFDVLMQGFTAVHLEAYVEQHRKRLEEGDETPFYRDLPNPDEPTAREWIVSQSRWTPDVKDAVEDVAHPLKGYILASMPPKQRLVMQLMRECWGMSVQELLQGHGVLEVEIRDQEFKLLTLGAKRHLQHITRVYLSPGGGKAMEVIQSRKVLRIVGPKAVSESCLKALHDVLQKKKTKEISLANVPTLRLHPQLLEELGHLTHSIVEYSKTDQRLTVTWLDVTNRTNTKLEDLSDTVFRLLLAARPAPRTDTALGVYKNTGKKARLVEDLAGKDKLLWSERRSSWARLCSPLTTTEAQNAGQSKIWPLEEAILPYKIEPSTDDYKQPKRESELKKRIRESQTLRYAKSAGVPLGFPRATQYTEEELLDDVQQVTKPTLSGWMPFRVRTDAVFGHVLHINHKNAASDVIHKGTDALAPFRRTLAPLIPPVTEMHLPGWVPYRADRRMTSLIVIRFRPSHASTALAAEGAAPTTTTTAAPPMLELRLRASDDEILSIESVRAVAHTHVADMCLPSEYVDVRATQRVVAELPGTAFDSTPGMEALSQFLRDSYLEPGQGRLVTPPVLDGLGLPQWLYYAPEADLQSTFLRTGVVAALYDAHKAAATSTSTTSTTLAAATGDPSSSTVPNKKKTSKKPKKSAKRIPALSAPPHNPYLASANALHPHPTPYLFAGLEVHRQIETAYDGWQLTYTSIEAGGGGGRRAQLALAAQPAADGELRRPAAAVGAVQWLRSVYRLAAGKAKSTSKKAEDEERGLDEESKGVVRWVGRKP